MESLPVEVRNIVEKVLKAEIERLDMLRPKGIKNEIERIIKEEIKLRED